jgi:hypothetical protein
VFEPVACQVETTEILDYFRVEPTARPDPEPARSNAALQRILRHRSGQLGEFVVVDDPDNLPASWTTTLERGSCDGPIIYRTTLNVLTLDGREQLARVAEEIQHTRSWGAQLVRSWIGRWTEHESFMTYIEEFPQQHPGLFSGGAQIWTRKPLPEVHGGDDVAARALWFAGGDHVEANRYVEWCEPEFGECVCNDCWRVELNLSLAPLTVSEALCCWPR